MASSESIKGSNRKFISTKNRWPIQENNKFSVPLARGQVDQKDVTFPGHVVAHLLPEYLGGAWITDIEDNCFHFKPVFKDGEYSIKSADVVKIRRLCSMEIIYVGWGVFHVTMMGENGVVLIPSAVDSLHVRQVLPYSMKFLIKTELKLSYIDDAVDQAGGSHSRRRSRIDKKLLELDELLDDLGDDGYEDYIKEIASTEVVDDAVNYYDCVRRSERMIQAAKVNNQSSEPIDEDYRYYLKVLRPRERHSSDEE